MYAMKSIATFVLAVAGVCFAGAGDVSFAGGRRCSLDDFPARENEADEKMCLDLKASYLQGYKYSKPVPIGELKKFLEKKNSGNSSQEKQLA